MEKVKVEVEVSKEAFELVEAVAKLVETASIALKDGFQPGTDLTLIFGGSLADLMKGIDGIDKLPAELKEDAAPFIKAWLLGGADVAALLLKK